MKKNKEKTKWYVLIAIALFVGAIIGFLATTNLSTVGKANYIISNGTLQDCCSGVNSEGLTYNTGIKDGCCILINMGYSAANPIADSCTIEQYNHETCNSEFKKMVDSLN